jgi:hypothetical protein
VAQYTLDQSNGMAGSSLSTLGNQITVMAQTLGQQVTLPQSTASSATIPAPPAASASQGAGKVNVTA